MSHLRLLQEQAPKMGWGTAEDITSDDLTGTERRNCKSVVVYTCLHRQVLHATYRKLNGVISNQWWSTDV